MEGFLKGGCLEPVGTAVPEIPKSVAQRVLSYVVVTSIAAVHVRMPNVLVL